MKHVSSKYASRRRTVRHWMLVAGALLAGFQARAEAFLSVAPDIPLAPGLTEAETGALIFDKPGGRIVSIEALAGAPSAEIFAFYRLSLPNLGWQSVAEARTPNNDRFRRDGEELNIKYEGGVVFFRLQPMAGN